MGNWLSTEVAQGVLRSVLISAGGALVADGVITSAQLQTGVGLIVALAMLIWSVISNHQKATAVEVVKAVEAHPRLTVVPARINATNKPLIEIAPQPAPGGLATPLGH